MQQSSPFVPAEAGTQSRKLRSRGLDSRLRGNERMPAAYL
jgi:hypothetical protein